jgi:ATP-dependent exoDNAse (exonuclease V) beta subunit
MKTFDHAFVELNEQIESVETPNGRRYRTPEGVFQSVTTVTGWKKRAFFAKWRRDNPEESKRVLSRGTKLHAIIETYLRNSLTPTALAEATGTSEADLFVSMQEDINRIGKIFAIEVPLWSKKVGLAGRTDCIGEFDGVPSVIDFKSSNYPKSEDAIQDYFMQATAYALMWQDLTGQQLRNIAILIGVEDGGCQVFTADPRDYVEDLVDAIRTYREEQPLQVS